MIHTMWSPHPALREEPRILRGPEQHLDQTPPRLMQTCIMIIKVIMIMIVIIIVIVTSHVLHPLQTLGLEILPPF